MRLITRGKVAADAIYYVRDAAPADAFTWTPTLPSAGSWRILVRWPASSGNTASAQYTVTHAGGTSTVTLNQKQNGGVWNSLGTYSLTPGAGHKVTLAASTDGTTIADAILFAGPTVQPANLLYVHADHLGAPQKLTNTTQAIAWDGVFDPFGEEVALTGLAVMPMRFPGQYADDETGYSYNYFRDYDSALGRYIQSDPIGLMGGINRYAYVRNNPTVRIDPSGRQEAAMVACFGGPNPICIGATAVTACKWAVIGTIALGGLILLDEATDDAGTPATDEPKNNNPYKGPVDEGVVVVDPDGNAIPVEPGQQIGASPDGKWQQVKDKNNVPTGTRKDGGGHPNESDARAQQPHAHVPGVTNDDGTPWLPLRPQQCTSCGNQ